MKEKHGFQLLKVSITELNGLASNLTKIPNRLFYNYI